MIELEANYGDEEYTVLAELKLGLLKAKKSRKIIKVIMIVLGTYEFIYGIHNLFSTPCWVNFFCLAVAALAFFWAFGGDMLLMRRMVLKNTIKLNKSMTSGYRKYTFSEEGMTVQSELGNGNQTWNAFSDYGEYSHYLWIQRKDMQYVLADMNKLSPADGALLRQYCAEKIEKK